MTIAKASKTSAVPAVSTAPAAPSTPVMDALVLALAATYSGADRWTIEGWAGHIRGANHPLHAINSLVKHACEFSHAVWCAVFAITIARCADGEMTSEDAAREIFTRRSAKTMSVGRSTADA